MDSISINCVLARVNAAAPTDLFNSDRVFDAPPGALELNLLAALDGADLPAGRWAWGVQASDGTDATNLPADIGSAQTFRTFVRNLPMANAMGQWGSYELSKRLSLTLRDREIVIDRTCARCRCEYEWGVHVAFFADRAGFNGEQITSARRSFERVAGPVARQDALGA